jgi:hypothetical protein
MCLLRVIDELMDKRTVAGSESSVNEAYEKSLFIDKSFGVDTLR